MTQAGSAFGSWLLGPAEQSGPALRVRVQALLTGLLVITNVIGVLVVLVLFAFVIPGPDPSGATLLVDAIAVPVYVGLAVLLGAVFGTRGALRTLRWAVEQREPAESDRRATLRVPWRLTVLQAMLWLLGTALFTALAGFTQPELTLTVLLTVGITGVLVCAIAYLLGEFALRPVAARALAGTTEPAQLTGVGVQRRMLLFWLVGTGVPVIGLVVVALLALGGRNVTFVKLAVVAIVLGAVVLVFGLLVTVLNARAVVAPIRSVGGALRQVSRGELDVRIPVFDGSELGQLQSGFNRMADGLRERERIRDLFGKHVGHEVADAALRGSELGDAALGGEVRRVSVLFVDLVGSTSFAETLAPQEVVAVLNRFCAVVVREVNDRRGLVNKFMGDAVLAVFGAPVHADDHSGRALATARAIADRLAAEVSEISAGIGVATGEVVAGNVGDRSRFEYTVIGDAVNEAARLTELAKDRPDRVLASMVAVRDADPDEATHWHPAERVTLRGRRAETELAARA